MSAPKTIPAPRVIFLTAAMSDDAHTEHVAALVINGVSIVEECKENMHAPEFFGDDVEINANRAGLALGVPVERIDMLGTIPSEKDWPEFDTMVDVCLYQYAAQQLRQDIGSFDRLDGVAVTGTSWAHVAARAGLLPEGFDQWDIADGEGWTVAHEAAKYGHLPKGFDRFDLARPDGWSVAHVLAVGNKLPEGFDQWELTTTGGMSVADIVRGNEEREMRRNAGKLQRILDGETVVADDEWLNSVDLPNNVAAIPNPDRVGLRDVYLVGKIDNPVIHEWRVKNGIVEPGEAPVKTPKMGM